MEIKTIASFLGYYERVREITNRVVSVVPPDQLDWTYMPGKFSVGDLVRHIAAIERNLFAAIISGNPVCYTGCGKELADGYDDVVRYFNEMHRQSMAIFRSLSDADLERTIHSASGKPTTVAAFLRALIIHEIHHRAALCIYLNLLQVKTPPVLGLTEEEVITISKSHQQ